MRPVACAILAVGTAWLVGPNGAQAQLGYLWAHEELLQKADVAVVAECVRTVDTGRVRPHPELTPALPVHELETLFRVSAVLKERKPEGKRTDVRLRHYRYTDDAVRTGLVNGGTWLSLTPGKSYLLFLVEVGRGTYEPLSGHTFPDDSVYLLQKAGQR